MDEPEAKEDRLYQELENTETLRAETYEKVTATILEDKLRRTPAVHTVTHDHDLQCDFGEKQMDVFLQAGEGDEEVTAIVECKGRETPMEKDHLASFAFYLEHSDANKGIYVSRSGYRSGAKQIAKEGDIQLFEISLISDASPKYVEGEFTHRFGPFRHHILVKDLDSGDWLKLSKVLYSIHKQLELPVLDETSDPTGDTIEDRLPDSKENGEGKIETTFEDGEQVRVDGKEYELWKAVSMTQPEGGDGSSFEIDFEDRVDLKLRDVLADQDEYVSFDEIQQQFVHVETDN